MSVTALIAGAPPLGFSTGGAVPFQAEIESLRGHRTPVAAMSASR